VTIAAQAGVMGDIEDKQIVIGSPAMPAQHARRVYMIFTKLPDVVERLKQLEQRLSALEDEAGGDIHL
jgi:UDP-3-O-[3-hydroxymyristoyl] glucosamine N-acyltransferase